MMQASLQWTGGLLACLTVHNRKMPNISAVFKEEISRVARKEVRAEMEALKKASVAHRSSIAELRRQVTSLERELKKLTKEAGQKVREAAPAGDAESGVKRRFSAERLAAHRTKIGLSAALYGKLMGVSGQTIYHWEQGKARPRAVQIEKLAQLRELSPREASVRLESA